MPETSRRYFEGSFPELAARLDAHFERLRGRWSAVAGKASALVLGGGYGRGDGGVIDSGKGAEFFNDLDYFLFSDLPEDGELVAWCHEVERDETAALGVDVEIKRLPRQDVQQGLETMMFADLVAGHVAVAGDASFLGALAGRLDFSKVGAADAARLLWNRGSGLYFARDSGKDPEFIVRNHAKLKLALGDAWLCLSGLYVPACRERGRRFAELDLPEDLAPLQSWHAEAVEFKFRPSKGVTDAQEIARESRELAAAWLTLFLRVESARLGCGSLDLPGYLSVSRLFPEVPAWKCAALAARDRLKRGSFLRPVSDYPRGALMRALPCLLELGGRVPEDASRYLPSPGAGSSWRECYMRWWQYYC